MSQFYAAAVQMTSTKDKDANLRTISDLTAQAVSAGAKLVSLPEYASYFSSTGRLENAEDLNGKTISQYRELATKHGIHFHGGSFVEMSDDPERSFNTTVFIGPNGDILASYRKIHLYDVDVNGQVLRESATIQAGNKAIICDTELGCMGFTICYDLRFPDLFRNLADNGAELLFVPAAFNLYTGKDHWEPLLQARGIEAQAYVIAAAQFGIPFQGRQCFGNSMIVDPWGSVVSRIGEGIGFTIAQIDTDRVKSIRENVPSLANQRPFTLEKVSGIQ